MIQLQSRTHKMESSQTSQAQPLSLRLSGQIRLVNIGLVLKTGLDGLGGTEQNYDGGYDVSTYLLIGYDNPYPFAWRNLRFFNQALSTDFIETNF
jgi:hypothetical protein